MRQSIVTIANAVHVQALVENCVAATRIPVVKAKNAKRKGATSVKKLEALRLGTKMWNLQRATTFRALAARGIYLAQDRPDIALACEELCGTLAHPQQNPSTNSRGLGATA